MFDDVLRHFQHYFSNIVAVSLIGAGSQRTLGKSPTCRMLMTAFITLCCIEYTSPSTGFELTTLGTDCIGSYKSNYHTIMTTTAPEFYASHIYSWQYKCCYMHSTSPIIESQWLNYLNLNVKIVHKAIGRQWSTLNPILITNTISHHLSKVRKYLSTYVDINWKNI